MGCIRVDKITEYLCDPLQRCLKVGGAQLCPRAAIQLSQGRVDAGAGPET